MSLQDLWNPRQGFLSLLWRRGWDELFEAPELVNNLLQEYNDALSTATNEEVKK
jgi:hypothetical protein